MATKIDSHITKQFLEDVCGLTRDEALDAIEELDLTFPNSTSEHSSLATIASRKGVFDRRMITRGHCEELVTAVQHEYPDWDMSDRRWRFKVTLSTVENYCRILTEVSSRELALPYIYQPQGELTNEFVDYWVDNYEMTLVSLSSALELTMRQVASRLAAICSDEEYSDADAVAIYSAAAIDSLTGWGKK